MSAASADVKFSLKVMINKEKNRVLFVEADSDFADVLLSFLTMPLGRIVKVLEKHYGDEPPVIGSLSTLYNSLATLNTDYFLSEVVKQMLIDPRSRFDDDCRKLKININETHPIKYFTCEDLSCGDRHENIGIYHGTIQCGNCGNTLNREINVTTDSLGSGIGVFSTKEALFLISDDMRMEPNVVGSIMETLGNLGITDTKDAEMRNVTFGLNEIMDLLKGMFVSPTPLTDIILGKTQNDSAKVKSEPEIILHNQIEQVAASNSEEMMMKIIVQKSTNKLMFAQVEKDFVGFLFSLLTIPLAKVANLLGSETCLKNIDNLYRSLSKINMDRFFKSKDIKSMLLDPKLPYGCISKVHILPLIEERAPLLYYYYYGTQHYPTYSPEIMSPKAKWNGRDGIMVSNYKSPKDGDYVKGSRTYMVTDDLTVSPLCMFSSLSLLNGLKIPLSDVVELKLHIGLEEALSILKEALISPSALTNALFNPSLKKSLKREV